jgi:hypothetical protein
MELKSSISSLFLHAGKDLGFSPNQMPYPVPLLLTGNSSGLSSGQVCEAFSLNIAE